MVKRGVIDFLIKNNGELVTFFYNEYGKEIVIDYLAYGDVNRIKEMYMKDKSIEEVIKICNNIDRVNQYMINSSMGIWNMIDNWDDLIYLNNKFLEGKIYTSFDHLGPLASESVSIKNHLIKINKKNILTVCSQPGLQDIGNVKYRQRSFLECYVLNKYIDLFKIISKELCIGIVIEDKFFDQCNMFKKEDILDNKIILTQVDKKNNNKWTHGGTVQPLYKTSEADVKNLTSFSHQLLNDYTRIIFIDPVWGQDEMFGKIVTYIDNLLEK